MKKVLLLSCILASTAVAGPDQVHTVVLPTEQKSAVHKFTLREAEAFALQNHPRIASAKLTADSVRQEIRQARSRFFPQITAELNAVGAPEETRVAATGGLNNPSIYSRQSDGIVINQLITDFGRTYELMETAKARAGAYDYRVDVARAAIILGVDRAYFELQRAQSVLKVAEETVKAREVGYEEISALVRSKLKSDLDASFEKVYLNQAKLLLIEARSQVGAAEATLSTALGFRDTQRFALVAEPMDASNLASAEPMIRTAMAQRPELKVLRGEQEALQRFTKAERAAQYPRVTAQGAAGVTPIRNNKELNDSYYTAGLNVEIPIANGGNLAAKVDEARLASQAAMQNLIDAENTIVRDIRLAFLKAKTDRERIGVTLQLVEASSDARELARVRYRLGSSSITDLSQAELNFTEAQLRHASATFDYQIGRALLDFVTGLKR